MWWRVAAGLVVIIALATIPPKPHYQGVNQKPAAQISSSTPTAGPPSQAEAVDPALYRRPCQNTPDDSQSELCAQWKSAEWTKWGVLVGILGTIGLLWQIKLTREALEDTGRATAAMERQNELTEHAQRPWIDISIDLHELENNADFVVPRGTITWKNIGKSVAQSVRLDVRIIVSEPNEQVAFTREINEQVKLVRRLTDKTHTVFLPGQAETRRLGGEFPKEVYVKRGHIAVNENHGPEILVFFVVSAIYRLPGQPADSEPKRTIRIYHPTYGNTYVLKQDFGTYPGKDFQIQTWQGNSWVETT